MKHKFFSLLIVCSVLDTTFLQAVSVVYNLFIVETSKNLLPGVYLRPSGGAVTGFNEIIKRYDTTMNRVSGELNTIFTTHNSFYIKADFAFANIAAKNCCTMINFSKIQTDDLVFTGGYTYRLSKRTKFVFSGLLGMPTHNDMSLIQPLQFGTGHPAFGGMVNVTCGYRKDQTFIAIARLIHFFPRHVCDILGEQFKYNIGDLADLYVAHNSSWNHHTLQVGYDVTFDFNPTICPKQPSLITETILAETQLIASHLFADYTYSFYIKSHVSSIIIGVAYSRDHRPPIVGHKYNFGSWVTWGVNF